MAADNSDKGKSAREGDEESRHRTKRLHGRRTANGSLHMTQLDPKLFDYATFHIAIAPSSGGEAKVLTLKLDRNSSEPRFSPDGKWIYFIVDDDGTQNLMRVPAMGGEITRPIGGRRMVESYTLGKDGSAAAVIGELTHPAEIYFLPADGGDLRRLTTTNDALMAQIRLPNVEYVHFKSKDGTTVAGYLYEPPDYKPGTRYPTILRPHGGPVWAYYAEFNFDPQLFAANGYVVLDAEPTRVVWVRAGFLQSNFRGLGPQGL